MKCFYHNDADGKCAGFWVSLSAAVTEHGTVYDLQKLEAAKELMKEMENKDAEN